MHIPESTYYCASNDTRMMLIGNFCWVWWSKTVKVCFLVFGLPGLYSILGTHRSWCGSMSSHFHTTSGNTRNRSHKCSTTLENWHSVPIAPITRLLATLMFSNLPYLVEIIYVLFAPRTFTRVFGDSL